MNWLMTELPRCRQDGATESALLIAASIWAFCTGTKTSSEGMFFFFLLVPYHSKLFIEALALENGKNLSQLEGLPFTP